MTGLAVFAIVAAIAVTVSVVGARHWATPFTARSSLVKAVGLVNILRISRCPSNGLRSIMGRLDGSVAMFNIAIYASTTSFHPGGNNRLGRTIVVFHVDFSQWAIRI